MNEYRHKKKKINDFKNDIFSKIYHSVIENIKLNADNLQEFCVYEVPSFIFGEPIYSLDDMTKYILNNLNKEIEKGNLIEAILYDKNIIYIKWSLNYN